MKTSLTRAAGPAVVALIAAAATLAAPPALAQGKAPG